MCPEDTNNTYHQLFGTSSPVGRGASFNQTQYDELIYRVVPVLTTIVPDESETSGTGPQSPSSTEPQALLVCLRAKDVKDGSRVPPALQAVESTE